MPGLARRHKTLKGFPGFFIFIMAKDPAFLFYPADFMIGTAFMSHDQRGKYISLLCYQHQLGRLTEEQIIDVCGFKDALICTKFKIDEKGLFYNERLEIEQSKRIKFCESRRVSRSYGKRRTSDVRATYVRRMENENRDLHVHANTSTPTNTTIPNKHIVFNFDNIWSKYPKRIGKKAAMRHFSSSVKTEKDYDDIFIALNNYSRSETVSNGFIQNGSTWFNNWRDWIDIGNATGKSQELIDLERMAEDARKHSLSNTRNG